VSSDNIGNKVNPSMIVLARESRGLTQGDLAWRLGITAGTMSRIEGGLRSVTQSLLDQIAGLLGYPIEFFEQVDPIYGFGTSEVFHRKRQDVSQKTINMIHAQINMRRMHLERMLRGVEIGDVDIPYFDLDDFKGNVEDIARAVRAKWHIPGGPIRNLTKIVEDARGIVIPFNFGTSQIDAMSWWPPSVPPLFFLDYSWPSDRLRFSLCHELGHIVMHREYPNPNMEDQAHRFAAEFLMPERDIRPYLNDVSIPLLASLKPFWKVSMSALLYRAKELGVISPRHARTLWMQMNKLGYRVHEPQELDLPQEQPTLYREIIDVYRRSFQYTSSELAKILHLHEPEIRAIYLDQPTPLKVVVAN